jgi:serine protease
MNSTVRRVVVTGLCALLLVGALGAMASAQSNGNGGPPPWAPGEGGPDVVHQMRGNAPTGSASANAPLTYHGGAVESAGQTSGGPRVFVVFWGTQWNGNDPAGEAGYLTSFLSGLYGSQDTWSTSTTQYCSGVALGATSCSGASPANTVPHPLSSPLVGGVASTWYDSATPAPKKPSQSALAAEAVRAAGHFSAPAGSQIVVATAHNNNAAGFGSSYCAWHSSTSSSNGPVAYTNLPYIPDAGASCGAGFVTGPTVTVQPQLQGVSIVGGHEYAETVTDPFPNSGWLDANGAENGDKCAWIRTGQGASAQITLATGNFTVQSLWSNATTNCVVSYP